MDERKKRIMRFFMAAYIIFGASIAYLMFFNMGISVDAKTGISGRQLDITVKNSSIHLITGLELFILDANGFEKKILSAESLKPGEEKTTTISEQQAVNGVINLEAKAPYHLTVSKKIQVSKTGSGLGNEILTVEMDERVKAFLGMKTGFDITVCNTSHETITATIEGSFSKEFFSTIPESKTTIIQSDECSTQEFDATPSAKGKTTIAFNIKTEKLNKSIEKEIEIVD